jgi:hypothetical protein
MKDPVGFITIRIDDREYLMTKGRFDGIVTLFKRVEGVDWDKVMDWIKKNQSGNYIKQTEEELYG